MSFKPTKELWCATLYKVLHKALGMKRPHATAGTAAFSAWLQTKFPANTWHVDGAGNMHVDLRGDPAIHRTLFVAHVDTVHKTTGKNVYTQTMTTITAKGDVLGADDGAGVALLMHMMAHGIPAYYLFTQGEERGGIGAKFAAKNYGKVLVEMDRAIAFDRRGTDSVISYQGFSRCCSDTFGDALARELNDNGGLNGTDFFYSVDPTGVYTDTAEFTDLISECTNISVGYDHEHTTKECLDMTHYHALAKAVLAINWDALPTERDPMVEDVMYTSKGKWADWGSGLTYLDDTYTNDNYNHKYEPHDLYGLTRQQMINICYDNPELFVDMVRDEMGLR